MNIIIINLTSPMDYGYSFSKKQCDWLDIEWKDTLESLSLFKQFKYVRLGTYWNEIEKEKDNYDFTQIKAELDIIQNSEQQAIVTLGMKAPRWPEFYIPDYLQNYPLDSNHFRDRTLKFVKTTIHKLKNYNCIKFWQVENEPLDPSGPDKLKIDYNFLKDEIEQISILDKRKIMLNIWGNSWNLFSPTFRALKITELDYIGYDFYPRQYSERLNKYRSTWLPKFIINWFFEYITSQGKVPYIAELQAEPWEDFDYRSNKEKIESISTDQIKKNIRKYKSLNPEMLILWGAEYWFWRGISGDIISFLTE